MRVVHVSVFAMAVAFLAGCVSPEEQCAMDQRQCTGYGFAPGTDAFANCMMTTSQQRDAQMAADRRAADERAAADRRAREAQDQADQDAWDKRTGQGKYANTSSSSQPSGPSMPDLSGMNCTSTSSSSGSPNNMTTTTNTSCHN